MKLFAVFAGAAVLLTTPTFAEDAKAPATLKTPTCGKTAEECQKVVDTLQIQNSNLSKELNKAFELLNNANGTIIQSAGK